MCKDETGYLVNDEKRGLVWRECGCIEQRRIRRLMKSSQMSEQMRGLRLNNFDLEGRPESVIGAFHCAKDYASRFEQLRGQRRNSIALLGIPGTGKTHLLGAIANHLLKYGVGVLYFPHVEGFGDIRDNLDEMEQKLGLMKNADVLYWDDLYKGREKPSDFVIDCTFNVINYRYLHNKPIMVSSERDIDTICGIDMGIGSRIYEMTKDHTVILMPDPANGIGVKELNYRLKG